MPPPQGAGHLCCQGARVGHQLGLIEQDAPKAEPVLNHTHTHTHVQARSSAVSVTCRTYICRSSKVLAGLACCAAN
eukprot:1158969-Pelagomonas_calceolata.AAC.8